MVQIKLDGTNLIQTVQSSSSNSVKNVFTSGQGEDRFRRSFLRTYYDNNSTSAALGVQNSLQTLKDSIASFRWPDSGFSLNRERLLVADPKLDGNVSSYLPGKEDVASYDRFFSRGFTGAGSTLLDDRTYKFQMSFGDKTETLEVDVTDSMKNDDVLNAIAAVVNNSRSPVQASVVTQTAPGLNQDDLLGTGSALVFSVNTAYGNDELSFRDISGQLISSLKLKKSEAPIGPANEALYSIRGVTAGSVSSFLSKSVDPNAPTSLSAGSHSIDYSIGPESGTISFSVESTDTWFDVLNRIASEVATASDKLEAEVTDTRMPSEVYSGDGYYMIDAKAVKISAKNPKIGERLELSPAPGIEVLGLNLTSQPGSDSKMIINGREEVRAPGLFSMDKGRVVADLEGSFGETLPLRVVNAIGEIESNISAITESYNSFRKTFLSVESLFKGGFADLWRDPIKNKAVDFNWMGLREAGKEKMLWFDSDAFYEALGSEPDKVHEILNDDDSGLIPVWKKATDEVLENKVSSYLIPESSLPDKILPEPTPRTELELERASELLDLYSTESFDFDAENSGPLVNLKG